MLIHTKNIDQALLDSMAAALPISDLRLIRGADAIEGAAALRLTAPDGTRLGSLMWQPSQPGWGFLRSMTPSLAFAIAAMLVLALIVLRRARHATAVIEAGERRFRDVADAGSDWVWETDPELHLNFLSERFATATGISPKLLLGQPLSDLLHAAEDPARWERHQQDLAARRAFRNLLCRCEDDRRRVRTLRVAGKPIADARGQYRGYRGTATDITAELEAERRVQHLARYDPLTELPNRARLGERLEEAVATVSRRDEVAAVICLDLDRFKHVNDALGHALGDQLIKRCGERLQACVRETDTVARIGGDEFAIVQVGINSPTGRRSSAGDC